MKSRVIAAPTVTTMLGQVADEFTQRLNDGERPTVDEYAARHPEIAELLRDTLSALLLMRASEPVTTEPLGTLGDYRLLRQIGSGGMGVVYEAEQMSLGRRVALKVLPFAATLDARQLQRFKNEAQAAALLHHPHIVPVHGMGVERAVHFYAMQYVEGQSLAEVIADLARPADLATPIAPTRPAAALSTERSSGGSAYCRAVARLGVQAAEALHHAHQQGIVHRDIKPANLMLDGAGKLWITDFGLARCRLDGNLTRTGDVLGTLRYMSPEQALGKPSIVDGRSDIYALGATLYEMLTLRPAYVGCDREELLRKLANEDPVPPRRLDASIAVELETIVLKAMAREPERRYATAEEVADDLRRFLEHRPILARRPGPALRLAMFARRHQAASVAVAVVLFFALVSLSIGSILLWQQQQKTQHALDLAKAAQQRAEANFRHAQDGAVRLFVRAEQKRWDGVAGINALRDDLADEGLRFFREFLSEDSTDPALRFDTARTYRQMARIHGVHRDIPQIDATMNKTIAILEQLTIDCPTDATYRLELARTHDLRALIHWSCKEPEAAHLAFARARENYRLAVPVDAGPESANANAWFLVDCPDEAFRDPTTALGLARVATERGPNDGRFWNTLGIAQYRAGDWLKARGALLRSVDLTQGGSAWDWFFLAMVETRLGHIGEAQTWYDKAKRDLEANTQAPEDLVRYRAEADALMRSK